MLCFYSYISAPSASSAVELHAEETESAGGGRATRNNFQTLYQYISRIAGINHTIIPEPCGTVIRVSFLFIFFSNFIGIDVANAAQNKCGLIASHHRNTRVWVHKKETW